ncbi:hypothetical protein ELH80_14165 [Rhizobium ruizarguesonis]|uniref:hypothetical protein n=1 Tax=Rhizobium ruizarguesonis TaxID=2081791 RepID=UPI0010327435|nr:hypothetical protein [Rhizobium ruizarguesonis]TAZ35427.1 hypothetical protein ELH80_14165 [Rhizobium ruizarguesonis]
MNLKAAAVRLDEEKIYNIRRALSEACYWGRAIERNQKKPSDQRWVDNFSNGKATLEDLKRFFPTYQIHRAGWNYEAILDQVNDLHDKENWTTVEGIRELAKSLPKDLEDTKDGKSLKDGDRTSAASKIAMFARPNDDVFIWDRLARVAMGVRAAKRDGASKAVRYDTKGPNSYGSFHSDCLVELKVELQSKEFNGAVDDFMAFTTFARATRNDPSLACRSYFERRLFDKVLVCEGVRIEELREAERPSTS